MERRVATPNEKPSMCATFSVGAMKSHRGEIRVGVSKYVKPVLFLYIPSLSSKKEVHLIQQMRVL